MIIPNIVIGKDKYGHHLHCGDICNFKVQLQRPKCKPSVEEIQGMIVYDESSYAYAFITLDDYAPILCMYCIEDYHSIEKIFEANSDNFKNMPNGEQWKELYNSHVKIN